MLFLFMKIGIELEQDDIRFIADCLKGWSLEYPPCHPKRTQLERLNMTFEKLSAIAIPPQYDWDELFKQANEFAAWKARQG
jgi:hypothetical protein